MSDSKYPFGEGVSLRKAKKEIRRGKKSTGASVRAKVQDEFGREHGYGSDISKKLNASRLVQRKYAQERRQTDRSQPSAQRGAAKDWEGQSKFGEYGDASETFTRKEGRQINRATNKKNKKESRETTKGSKARAKLVRKGYL